MIKVSKWLAAAALLFAVGGGAAKAQDVTLPDKGTTEYSLNGNISFEKNSSWQVNGRWAPFASKNLQWGIDLTVLDGPGISTSGFIGGLINWYFRNGSDTGTTLPYIGAGLAGTFGDLNGSVWDVHAGLKYFVNTNVAFTAELQYLNFSNNSFAGNDNTTQLNFGISVFR